MVKVKFNLETQHYKGIPFQLINRGYARDAKAKRFTLNGTNQNIWIPNKHLLPNGTLREGEDIDYVFRKANRQLELAGITQAIPGIKRRNVTIDKGVGNALCTFCPSGSQKPATDWADFEDTPKPICQSCIDRIIASAIGNDI